MFHVSWGGRGGDNVVGWVCGLKCVGKELGGEEGEVVAHWKNLNLCSCTAEGGVFEWMWGRSLGTRWEWRKENGNGPGVIRIVSFCWPQVVPSSARRMLIRRVAREIS